MLFSSVALYDAVAQAAHVTVLQVAYKIAAKKPAAVQIFKPGAIRVHGKYGQGRSDPASTAATAPFTPMQLTNFYGINDISFGGVTGNGSGGTIAVLDAYRDNGFVSSTDPNFSTSDLKVFDNQFMGGVDPPSFTVIPESGQALPTTTATGSNAGWAGETALDVEWAHAIAPMANIILVECISATNTDLITNGVAAARAAGANVISMSFGAGENRDTSYDRAFTTSTSNNNVTYVASAGDDGVADTGYPAFSPYVVSVAGTSITTSDASADYGSEVVWNDTSISNGATGGGISGQEAKPTYQDRETLSGNRRGVPDVAFEADPQTGVYVYDSTNGGYYGIGGTSLSAPCWAGLIAIADQGRASISEPALNGFSGTLPRLYQLPATDFHDITSGNNTYTPYSSETGYSAGTGYDLVSGLGTPVANTLIADLAGVGTVTGREFVDTSGNGTYSGTDVPLTGQSVYLDLNDNGVQDVVSNSTANEPSTTTNSSGIFSFSNQSAGGVVRLTAPTIAGYVQIPNGTSTAITYGTTDTTNFTYFPIVYSTSTVSTNYTLQMDNSGEDQILVNGVVTDTTPKTNLSTLTFNLTGAGDTFTVNAVNGNPVPAGGVTLTGATGGDALNVIGTALGNDSFVATSSSISFNGNAVNFSNVSLLTLNPGNGIDSLNVSSGSVTIAAQTPGSGILTRNFSSMSIASGASTLLATASAHTDRMLVEIGTLSVLGKLDLGGNDMIIHNGNLAAITTLLTSGYANGNWNGTGIASSAAASNTAHLTALGVIQNNLNGGSGQAQFDGASALTSDVLIKYTYYGDADLSGKVDGSDYSRIDNGSLFGLTGWANGDFNYDNYINGSDYTLIDNAFNTQGSML